MSYSFTIGKAKLVTLDEFGDGPYMTVEECAGPAPHSDEWEAVPNEGKAHRWPSYGAWGEVVGGTKSFKALWARLERWAKEYKSQVIPVTEYIRELDKLEQEAPSLAPEVAARVLWFSLWSRQALKLYGEAAAFETPGEWIDWELD